MDELLRQEAVEAIESLGLEHLPDKSDKHYVAFNWPDWRGLKCFLLFFDPWAGSEETPWAVEASSSGRVLGEGANALKALEDTGKFG